MDRIDKASVLAATVIIPSRNRPVLLLETIQGVLNGSCLPAELVIVDQSEAPNTKIPALSSPDGCEIRYAHAVRPGVSAARNLGARLASHDLLLFLDDDLTVDRDWLSAMARELERVGPGVIATGQVREAAHGAGKFVPSVTGTAARTTYVGTTLRDVLSSGNMGLYRSALEATGGFDERLGPGTRFPAAEDNDLALRLLESGCEIVFLPEALAWHRAWRSERDVIRVQWHYGIGQGAFYGKHLRNLPLPIARRVLRDISRPARSLPDRLRSRRLHRFLGDIAFAGGVLLGVGEWGVTNW